MKYRWLDSEKPVRYRGRRNPELWDRPGDIVTLPVGASRVGNVLVDFHGTLAVCPAGTLRNVRHPDGTPRAS
jgi:hypothetical protein